MALGIHAFEHLAELRLECKILEKSPVSFDSEGAEVPATVSIPLAGCGGYCILHGLPGGTIFYVRR